MFKKLPKLLFRLFHKRNLYYLLTVFLIFLLSIATYIGHQYFLLEKIEVRGTARGQQLFGLVSLEKQNLLFINTTQLEEDLKNQNPFVKTVSITKHYPRELSIIVSTYYPIAYLKTQMGYFQLSEDGRILSKSREEKKNLPIITYYQNFPFQGYQAGDNFSFKDIQYALHFAKKTQLLGIKINSIDIKGLYMLGLYSEEKKQTLLFSAEKDQATQDYQLEVVLGQLKREGKEFEKLDVRYDKPIVVLKK